MLDADEQALRFVGVKNEQYAAQLTARGRSVDKSTAGGPVVDVNSPALDFNYNPLSQLHGQKGLNELVETFSGRLGSQITRDQAFKVLNFYTLNLYEDRDIDWWKKHYKDSKLAAIFEGKSYAEWSIIVE